MFRSECGQTVLEYALVIGGVSIVLALLMVGMFEGVLLDATALVDAIL